MKAMAESKHDGSIDAILLGQKALSRQDGQVRCREEEDGCF
jgi:hypothetical protein